jgi:hypothetical protein
VEVDELVGVDLQLIAGRDAPPSDGGDQRLGGVEEVVAGHDLHVHVGAAGVDGADVEELEVRREAVGEPAHRPDAVEAVAGHLEVARVALGRERPGEGDVLEAEVVAEAPAVGEAALERIFSSPPPGTGR